MDNDKLPTPEEPLPSLEAAPENLMEVIARDRPRDYHQPATAPVFVVDDSFFRARSPRSMHWSIAWSDLMMTMFILFLSLFVYQLAHREFLSEEDVEVVAGETMAIPPSSESVGFPFSPIYPQISGEERDTLKKVEPMPADEVEDLFAEGEMPVSKPEVDTVPETAPAEPLTPIAPQALPEIMTPPMPSPEPAAVEPPAAPLPAEEKKEIFTEIYDLSKVALEEGNLEKYASIELIPDKAMRIILTGDLLFDSGQADLTPSALSLLGKLARIIKQSPYVINVVGHTDSVPMSSARYPTNWELSTARASRVARYLIENAGIPASQIVVSGFSYYRPVRPNDTEENRSANRRVEIILSKELPPSPAPDPTTPQ